MSETPASPIPAPLLALLDVPTPPGLGPDARPGVKPVSTLKIEFAQAPESLRPSPDTHDLLLSAVLLWHDHLHESHLISKNIHNSDGRFLHAVMHRRQPDFGNSKYWWHRVGAHPCFSELGARAAALLDARQQPQLKLQLLPNGQWDPFAFVDACEHILRRGGTPEGRQLLRELQRIEFEVFLEYICRGSTP